MYQVRTYGDLCFSKKYLINKKEIAQHIKEVIKATESYRRKKKKEDENYHVEEKVATHELFSCINILKIDPLLLPEWERVLGKEMEITTPDIALGKEE